MATKVLSNEFMQNIATEEAWKELSSNFSWSEAMLEKYQDKVNWDEVTENRNIRWTTSMIQKFQKKINWEMFSRIADDTILTESNIETFKERWNWHELSNNSDVPFTEELLEKYADKWDWEQIIDIMTTASIARKPSNSTRSIRTISQFPNFRTPASGEPLSSRDQSNSLQKYACSEYHIQRTDAQGNHSLGI